MWKIVPELLPWQTHFLQKYMLISTHSERHKALDNDHPKLRFPAVKNVRQKEEH